MWIIIYIYKKISPNKLVLLMWAAFAEAKENLFPVVWQLWEATKRGNLCNCRLLTSLAGTPGSPAGMAAPWCQFSHEFLTSWPHLTHPHLSQVGLCVPTCCLSCISSVEDLTCLEMPALGTCLPEPRIRKTWASYLFFHFPSGPLLPPPATSPH